MAAKPLELPAFLHVKYEEQGIFSKLKNDAASATSVMRREFDELSSSITKSFDQMKRGGGLSLDLGTDEMRRALQLQQARTAAAEEYASAARRAATADGGRSRELQLAAAAADAMAQKEREAAAAAAVHADVIGRVTAELNRETNGAESAIAAYRRFASANDNVTRSAGAHRMAMIGVGQQLQDSVVQLQMGTSALTVFAQQGSQAAYQLAGMGGKVGAVASVMAGPWGAAVFAGTALLGPLIAGLFKTSDALEEVKFASDGVTTAQGILGSVMDLTTGKVTTQRGALLALAEAQILVNKVQAQQRATEARRDVLAIQDRPVRFSGGGLGGGFTGGRRPIDARDAISRDVLAGALDAKTAIERLSLYRVNDQCLALTAGHVIGDAVQATVTVAQSTGYRAAVLYKPAAVDVALLSVETGPSDRNCTDPLESSPGVQTLMNNGSEVLVLLAGGGLFGGAVTTHDQSWVRLEMRPGQMDDPRIEEGISGALVTKNGMPFGIVTDIRTQGVEKSVKFISFDEVRRQLADYLPNTGSTNYPAWDISWWPQPARDAIMASMEVGNRAARTASRAYERVNSAKAIIGNARAVPSDLGQIDPYLVYYFKTDSTAAEMRSQIKAVPTTPGRFSYSAHGLGEQVDTSRGRTFIGQWANGSLTIGEVMNGVTPQSPQGSDRIYGTWDDKHDLLEGDWYLADGRQLIGTFKGSFITRGRITHSDGTIFNGEWLGGASQPEGPCVWWSKDGAYLKGGICKNGRLVTPYSRPSPKQ